MAPSHDRERVRAHLASLQADGGTATGDGLAEALRLLESGDDAAPPSAVVLLSDGETTTGRDPVEVAWDARDARVPIYTVALGTSEGTITDSNGALLPVPPDLGDDAEIAAASGGESFGVDDGDQLDAVYERSDPSSRPGRRSVRSPPARRRRHSAARSRHRALTEGRREAPMKGETT